MMAKQACCCGSGGDSEASGCCALTSAKWIEGTLETPAGEIPKVSVRLTFSDTFGAWKARWGINRMDYAIPPGLYCVGSPHENSPVLVTANYKMTFDRLRRELAGLETWILVLDTKGINVWCAAGKGTFGTDELALRIEKTQLSKVVKHRRVILPQLGAPGVCAYEIKKRTGFEAVFGPVRASDIKAFIDNGYEATPQMRQVNFTTMDRLVLTPIEIMGAIPPLIIFFGVLFILNASGLGHYGFADLMAWLGTIFAGCVLAPVLLPWIPGKAFSFKGLLLGLIWAAGVNFIFGWPDAPQNGLLKAIAWMLLIPAITSFISLNFTGASTYTSFSGVDKEMKMGLPLMILAAFAGIALMIANDIVLLAV